MTGVVAPEGPLDLESAPRLKRTLSQLADQGCSQMIVDLSQVTFVDSTALAVLVGIRRRLGARGALVVAAADQQAVKLFELTGLDRALRLFPTVEAAAASLTGAAGEQPGSDAARVRPLPLTRDAAVVLGIAATAMPFADSTEDQVERWLHALRLHGQAGVALASLGFKHDPSDSHPAPGTPGPAQPPSPEGTTSVTARADRIATELGARRTGTAHLLLAVLDCYGPGCAQILGRHGVDAPELQTLLEAE